MTYINKIPTTKTGQVRVSEWKESCAELFEFKKTNNEFVSRIDDLEVKIVFDNYLPLYGSLATADQQAGLYVISCFPTNLILTTDLNEFPVVNEYNIYVGESSGTSNNSSVLKRLYEFRTQVEATIMCRERSKVHAAANAFAESLTTSFSRYDNRLSAYQVSQRNLYFRFARSQDVWEEAPKVHETVLMRRHRKEHPEVLFNSQV